jgi:hypothetical protein
VDDLHALALATLLAAGCSTPHHDRPIPAGKTLLRWQGTPSLPADVQGKLKGAPVTAHTISYRQTLDAASADPVSWRVTFGTVEDPSTHLHYFYDIVVTMADSNALACTATLTHVTADAHITPATEKIRAGMQVDLDVDCVASDHHHIRCGGTLKSDGTAPDTCNPFDQTNIKPPSRR